MTVIRPADLARFKASGWKNYPVILVHGADEGHIRETVAGLVATAAGPAPDPLDLVELEGDSLAQDPARLADELNALSMFGGQRVIHLRSPGRLAASHIEAAAESASPTPLIIEAGELRPGTALRALAERHRAIAAIACYADSARDLRTLIDTTLGAGGHTITRDARELLAGTLGADRGLSRSEIEKLALYAGEIREITAEMVATIISDAGRHDVGPLIDQAFAGTIADIEPEANRLFASGIHPSALLAQTLTHVFLLRRADAARSTDADLSQFKKVNRIHFSRAPAFDQAAQRWNGSRLDQALELVSAAVLNTRKSARLAEPVAIRALWSLARLARGGESAA